MSSERASIVPSFWAEATERRVVGGHSYTVSRFGWSDVDAFAAERHAHLRLAEALATLERDGDVRRRDHKIGYNGGEGLPIREEVVARFGADVVSRNGYGAACLNTPDVLFADIDYREGIAGTLQARVGLATLGAFMLWAWLEGSVGLAFLGLVATAIVSPLLARVVDAVLRRLQPSAEERALERIRACVEHAPELSLRVYATPAGLRVLAMHSPFAPRSDAAQALLEALGSDRLYMLMCANQDCFRARLTAKPWRIELPPIPGRHSAWPPRQALMAERDGWIARYEAASAGYAACRFVGHYGAAAVHPRCEAVRALHDEGCRALEADLPLA